MLGPVSTPVSTCRALRTPVLLGLSMAFAGPLLAQEPADPAAQAESAFRALEARLAVADSVYLEYDVVAEGIAQITAQGALSLTGDRGIEMTGSGQFGPQPIDVVIRTGADGYEYGNGSDLERAAIPDQLGEAILIGLTRMGILHNIARLTGNAPPDHADGGVQDWVTVGEFRTVEGTEGADLQPTSVRGHTTIHFVINVGGQKTGMGSLELDGNGLPVLRRQTVEFPQGELHVVERYSTVRIDP